MNVRDYIYLDILSSAVQRKNRMSNKNDKLFDEIAISSNWQGKLPK